MEVTQLPKQASNHQCGGHTAHQMKQGKCHRSNHVQQTIKVDTHGMDFLKI
jgi:hypothetical protein